MIRGDKESLIKGKKNYGYIRNMLDKNPETKGLTFNVVDWKSASNFYNGNDKLDPDFVYKVRFIIIDLFNYKLKKNV